MCDRPHDNEMPLNEGAHQLIDVEDIKQEPDIKEEPEPVGDLIEDGTEAHPLADYSQFGIEGNSTGQTINEVKIEVKEEVQQRNKPKSNDANGGGLDQRGEHLPRNDLRNPQSDRNGKTAHNARKSTGTGSGVRENGQKQHQCIQCNYTTRKVSNLARHLLKHTGEKPFPCDRCAKAFSSIQDLRNHIKVHVSEFLFQCSICLKGFDKKNEQMEHEPQCKTLRYECHLCEKSLGPYKYKLITHMRVHSGEKAFECPKCSKPFARKDYLKNHLKLHAGPRPFRCLKCRQGFSHEDEMIAHQQKCSRRMYECYVCGKFIACNNRNLEQHMRSHTGDKPFQCTQCHQKFTHKSSLNDHMRIHSRSLPWKCAICRQGFTKQSQWKAHQRNCTRRMYECHLCKKFFDSHCVSLKTHMRTHSGEKPEEPEKPFQCGICHNRFTLKGNLTRHTKCFHNKKY